MGIDIFKEMEKSNTEQIIFNYGKDSGLKAIIAINDTTIGPAVGGCRMIEYKSTDEALLDVIRLAEGMTYKCALSGGKYGGGKTVIIGDPKVDKNEVLLRDLGRFVQILNGRYYMGGDVGTTSEDMVHVSKETDYILSLPEEYGGYGDSARPTAYGVYTAIKAAIKFEYDKDSLKDISVAIQGAGKVGSKLVEYLLEEEAKVIISNRSEESIIALKSRFPQIKVVDTDKIYEQECDVFSPCALGGSINEETIEKLKCKVIAGAANNQLAEAKYGQILHDKGIIFAPDFVINSGGFISASDSVDMGNVNRDRVMSRTRKIYDLVYSILERSKKENIPTFDIAETMAREHIKLISEIKKKFIKY